MSSDDVPQPGQAVDVLLAVAVDEDRSVSLRPNVTIGVRRGLVQRVDQVQLRTITSRW